MHILIIEDESIIAENIAQILLKEGYIHIQIAHSFQSVLQALKTFKPHCILCDINLESDKTGVEIIEYLKSTLGLQFALIYISSIVHIEVVKQAAVTQPTAYLVKPFKHDDLLVALQLAYVNTIQHLNLNEPQILELKDGYLSFTVNVTEILYLKAEGNYTQLVFKNSRSRIVRLFLSEIHSLLCDDQFVRVHRSYIVNKRYISEVNRTFLTIDHGQIPIGRSFRHLLD